jgi:tRNA(Arg) A34 adenosine deaminase TadA
MHAESNTPEALDRQLLLRAVELSRQGMHRGAGGPFGAVIARDGKIVGEGYNRVTSANDPSAHAEVEAIRTACRHLGSFELRGCTIYASCEPCPMCLGAIYWARLDRLVYANTSADAAAIHFDDAELHAQLSRPLNQQKLPSVHIALSEARSVFEEWSRLEAKILY